MARQTRAEAKATTRAKLLKSAEWIFERHGYNGATVEEIADRAGFTRGAFYASFSDKADILLTLFEEGRTHDIDELTALVAATPDDDKLGAVQGWWDQMIGRERMGTAFAELMAVAARDKAVRARLVDRQRRQVEAIAAMVEAFATESGTVLPMPAIEFAGFVLATADGVSQQRLLDPTSLPDDAFSRAIGWLWMGMMAEAGRDTLGAPLA